MPNVGHVDAFEPSFSIIKITTNSTRILFYNNSMYGIHMLETLPIYGNSSLGMNSSLNCCRVIIHLTDRSGQRVYLYNYKSTSAHLHASECVVSFTVLKAHLDAHSHTHPAPIVRD